MAGYAINAILSVITAVLVYLLKGLISENRALREEKRKDEKKKDDALSAGVLSLLRIQLIEYHDKYMVRDQIPVYIFENWDEMFSAYTSLGGNGSIKRMNDELNRKRIGGGADDHRPVAP